MGGVLDEPIGPSKPPTEDPVISPSIDDLLKIKINEEDMIIGTNSWNAIAYGNGKYVAVGSSGYVTTSTNGTSWTTPVRIGTEDWYSVTYGNGKFVAVGRKNAMMSTNGTSWTTYNNVSTSYLISVTFGNGKFVMVGSSSYIGTSSFENKTVLSNEVEIDEVYLGGVSSKSKGQPGGQGRSTKYKTPVLGMVERGGKLNAIKVPNTKGSTIIPFVVKYIKDAIVYTDEWVGYKNVKDLFEHYIIKHGENEYVRGKVYTNTIEGFWSLLKRGFIGTYQYISKKHLQLYVDEFVFRYNTKMISEYDRFIHLLSNMCVRTRYNDLKIA